MPPTRQQLIDFLQAAGNLDQPLDCIVDPFWEYDDKLYCGEYRIICTSTFQGEPQLVLGMMPEAPPLPTLEYEPPFEEDEEPDWGVCDTLCPSCGCTY